MPQFEFEIFLSEAFWFAITIILFYFIFIVLNKKMFFFKFFIHNNFIYDNLVNIKKIKLNNLNSLYLNYLILFNNSFFNNLKELNENKSLNFLIFNLLNGDSVKASLFNYINICYKLNKNK